MTSTTTQSEPHPYFQVNLKDKTEVLKDGEHFARTGSHLDSMRIVMAMETTYKQMRKEKNGLCQSQQRSGGSGGAGGIHG